VGASAVEIAGDAGAVETAAALGAGRRRLWRTLLRNRMAVAGGAVVLFWALVSILAPLIARYDPISSQDAYRTLAAPSSAHLLGTDEVGRDLFSRLLYGGRASLGIGVGVVGAGVLLGLLLGGISGFAGGAVDEVIMRLADIVLAFPILVLAMAVSAALGPSLFNVALAMGLVWWPTYARVVRGLVLELKEREFVTAARAVGVGEWRILWRTVLPNTVGAVVILATLDVGNAILTVAGLSFIGFGVPAPHPEWGAIISEAQKYPDQWWLAVFPGIAIFTAIIGFNFFGDAVRDALDPRTR
jgi:ABC-type dipeptide/oligopeptide/nickel transport system permease subunit